MTEIKLSERRIIQQKGRQQSTPTHKKNKEKPVTNVKQNEKQQPHSEWTMNNKYFHSTKSKLYESKSHPRGILSNSESLSPKEALWTVQLHIKNCHKYTQHTDTHKQQTQTQSGNILETSSWKLCKKRSLNPESIKLSKTLHDHDLVEQAYSHSWKPDCYIRGLRSDECEWCDTGGQQFASCVMAHKTKRRKLGKISGKWKTYQISHNGATDSSMYL